MKHQVQRGDMTIQSQSLTKDPDLLIMLKQLLVMEAEMDRMKRKEAERTIQFNDYTKKVYNTMKELEEESEFSYQCIIIQKRLQKLEDLIIEGNEIISANKDNLLYQVRNFEATYLKIISNEQEIIRFTNQGKEILIKSSRNYNSNTLKIIDIVEKRWLKIRETLELGRTRINTCKEKCKKFYGGQEKFLERA